MLRGPYAHHDGTNRIQREAFRGLIATELTANFFVAKNFHMGFKAQ